MYVSIWTHGECYATVLCLDLNTWMLRNCLASLDWTHGECYATVLRNCLASLDLNTWMLRNCLVSLIWTLGCYATVLCLWFEHMVNATQLSYATVLRLSIWTHGECYATVLCLDLNTWMLRNCLASLDLNTWWMLRNCLTQLSCVSRFEHLDATQLSCVFDLNTWWMLRNCLTQLSCVSRFEHMVCATQLSCVSIWTLGCYATVLCLSIWTHGECYATVFCKCLASFDLNTWCVLRNCLVSLGSWDSGAHRTLI